ncbi:uncharacterized protein LOC130621985 [Hydractinia symbiolongicarpus]|uniref:uncharacterized protein LOC130621985 n=1 Tax=Hydractinia symbiolongicarpus TaxID=13093 RepID=UPI0025504529|nr:uncharacterized protein LOC130621982 isoform X2 [Hydractinia symbiolongicarpus]XP_057293361.1 uncharacterized protein LOC130621985 [Hydractinia symbiolongicarpus]
METKVQGWNFFIHGCINGYSLLITNLDMTTDNTAVTAYNCFIKGVQEYGIPSRIRMDGGTEFNHVEDFMNQVSDSKRRIRGKSVHNQRIERLWRDVYTNVLCAYRELFNQMETLNILDVKNDIHLFALHYVFKPRIAASLEGWIRAHNEHLLRSENSFSICNCGIRVVYRIEMKT